MSLETQFLDTVKTYSLIHQGDCILVGVSGGPDSVALLHLLHQASKESIPCTLHVCHLNHLLRGEESFRDEKLVEKMAKEFALPLLVERIDVPALLKKEKRPLESLCRKLRYEFYQRAALKAGANKIALGHTADDHAETILFRIIRGTGLKGLAGIPLRRSLEPGSPATIIRPLLLSSRKEIETYLKKNRIPFLIDSSNADETYMRNRIRHRLIPLLRKEFQSNIRRNLIRLGELSRDSIRILKSVARDELNWVIASRKEGELILDLLKFNSLDPVIRKLVVREAVEEITSSGESLDFRTSQELILFSEKGRTGKYIDLPVGLRFEKEYGRLHLYRKSEEEAFLHKETELSIPGVTQIPSTGWTFSLEIMNNRRGLLENFLRDRNRFQEAMDADTIIPPLVVRSRRRGDRFRPFGTQGEKKLTDFFIDLKIPRRERLQIPIVDMGGKPIWIVGYRIDHGVSVHEGTRKILFLHAEQGQA